MGPFPATLNMPNYEQHLKQVSCIFYIPHRWYDAVTLNRCKLPHMPTNNNTNATTTISIPAYLLQAHVPPALKTMDKIAKHEMITNLIELQHALKTQQSQIVLVSLQNVSLFAYLNQFANWMNLFQQVQICILKNANLNDVMIAACQFANLRLLDVSGNPMIQQVESIAKCIARSAYLEHLFVDVNAAFVQADPKWMLKLYACAINLKMLNHSMVKHDDKVRKITI